ncbi:hypothetical protein GS597_16905 [Synechococcales cyanobacterium C]|uniref:DUF4148 domain-containing protein n=1 Tax=Petrachloros mirabilis ULC683 TaxID=2781853 RepID=A0A8K2A1U9_9CYAN|nr:hypothetical protein [Petrachloros mirabilis]NCJ08156.1 hypothetical protein [Petrachloros mirabilis ULC683]
MFKQMLTLGLLSGAALGFVALPAAADTAVIQSSQQDVIIDGRGNSSRQSTSQSSTYRSSGSGRDSSAVVQDAVQFGEIYGVDNSSRQDTRQRSEVRIERDNRGSSRRGNWDRRR